MSKRIAFCADGTWDKASKQTNVYKLYKALLTTGDQIPLYDDGVGSDGNPLVMLLGGAFGTGLWEKIKEGYKKISHVYEQGDDLFIFGFSRGAYTARSLAGMIAACGLPTQDFTDDMVNSAFDAYRDKANRAARLQKLAPWKMFAADIKMVGVWDTVGSLGIPAAVGLNDPILYGFLDTGLTPQIKNAFHAMAMDERREQFMPTMWAGTPNPDQHVEQVWFTGAHSDVGGGEPDAAPGVQELSDVPLSWMIDKARGLGLQIDEAIARQYAHPLDAKYALNKFHESWNAGWGIPVRRRIPKDAAIANSVLVRCQADPEWRPSNLDFVNGSVAPGYKIVSVVSQPEAAAAQAQGGA
jgi:uncharacterized protein (DUF2235 family)